jgi:3-dehydroquinate dehydratase-2
MSRILIINGPNLNMLGTREPGIYGYDTLADIEKMCQEEAKGLGLKVDFRQSNIEGEIITWIQQAPLQGFSGMIINGGAYTHTSIAIMDALLILEIPIIEVHITNIFKREEFRHLSFVSPAAEGVICGLGSRGYPLALKALAEMI